MTEFLTTAFLPWLQAFATALLPLLGAMALTWLRRRQVNTVVFEAVGRAAGEAYKHIAASGRPVTDPVALAAGINAGGSYLLDRIPDTLRAAGLSPEDAAQIVGAELGKLMAIDPNVHLGPKA